MTDKTRPIGLYIHIPFCRSKCPYCDFYSFSPREELIDEYTKRVCEELKNTHHTFDTVYFGGGTPSFIGEKRITEILGKVAFTNNAEITVECNPSDTGDKERSFDFSALAQAGVNRISMGLQSSSESERRALGRRAGKDEVLRAVERAQNAGIDNISLDLMLGIPGQTAESLKGSVDFAVSADARHISAYILKIEENTFFGRHPEKYSFPSDDETADLYLKTAEALKEKGYIHYEISNFAVPGYESRHNLKYWKLDDYLGTGPAAHSFIGGKRSFYPADIKEYLSGCDRISDGEGGGEDEYIMLSLRLREGLDLGKYEERYSKTVNPGFTEKCRLYADRGFGSFDGRIFSLNSRGFLISNTVISELLAELD